MGNGEMAPMLGADEEFTKSRVSGTVEAIEKDEVS
jgi:hypothetical protein